MPSGQPNSESRLFYFSPHQHLPGESFLGRGEAVSVLLGQPFMPCNLPVCALCLSLRTGAPLFVFGVCELKASPTLTACLVCADVLPLLLAFHLCFFFLVQMCLPLIVKVICGFLAQRTWKVEKDAQNHATWRRVLPALLSVLWSLSCAVTALFFGCFLGRLSHRLLCLLTRPLCSWHGNVEYPQMTWLSLGGRTWGVLFIHFFFLWICTFWFSTKDHLLRVYSDGGL